MNKLTGSGHINEVKNKYDQKFIQRSAKSFKKAVEYQLNLEELDDYYSDLQNWDVEKEDIDDIQVALIEVMDNTVKHAEKLYIQAVGRLK